jgi:hypothetical protein
VGLPATNAGRPRFDIADIVREHRAALERRQVLSVGQRRVLSAIAVCRTAALGGHLDVCTRCGYEHPAYNSCRNRHCPKCQALAQERWIAARTERLLPVRHFHVVFTLPAQLRPLALRHPRPVFQALFQAAGHTLLELGNSRLHALLGITAVLHTWTRDLRFHPHVHALVTAGGLHEHHSRFVSSSQKYLFPVQVLGALLRGKMIDELRHLHAQGKLGNLDPDAFRQFLSGLPAAPWIVYVKKPFRELDHVLQYLGRYTHRVAIANSRLVEVTTNTVTFRTKDGRTVSLHPVEFLRRFLLHVLPHGFHKIRHYGLYAASLSKSLATARSLLPPCPGATPRTGGPSSTWTEQLHQLTGHDVTRCPVCGGPIQRNPLPRTPSRAPPAEAAS